MHGDGFTVGSPVKLVGLVYSSYLSEIDRLVKYSKRNYKITLITCTCCPTRRKSSMINEQSLSGHVASSMDSMQSVFLARVQNLSQREGTIWPLHCTLQQQLRKQLAYGYRRTQ